MIKWFNALDKDDLEVDQIAKEFCGRPHLWIDFKLWLVRTFK